ncbi:hypothetical protein [Psychrobacter sp. P11G5]|uniref:hypothetical protein n=1 Tax=Psychrobacter sp. P11G5 TaxID=1699624 RepID=UPI00078E5F89|nr:hypothetical protein [Psychrobacter sp. P11G5]AMN67811.1 hypothetical protein AK825_08940 [Psychrobacter sp. P11G5]
MGDVAHNEIDKYVLSMTQWMGLSHVVGDEVTGDGYPVGAVAALFSAVITLPMVSDMGTMVAVNTLHFSS